MNVFQVLDPQADSEMDLILQTQSPPHVASLARVLVQFEDNVLPAIEDDDLSHPLYPVANSWLGSVGEWSLHPVWAVTDPRGWGVLFYGLRSRSGRSASVNLVVLSVETEDVVGPNLGGPAFQVALSNARSRLRAYL